MRAPSRLALRPLHRFARCNIQPRTDIPPLHTGDNARGNRHMDLHALARAPPWRRDDDAADRLGPTVTSIRYRYYTRSGNFLPRPPTSNLANPPPLLLLSGTVRPPPWGM
jgi:hypothetical protein